MSTRSFRMGGQCVEVDDGDLVATNAYTLDGRSLTGEITKGALTGSTATVAGGSFALFTTPGLPASSRHRCSAGLGEAAALGRDRLTSGLGALQGELAPGSPYLQV
ncbi:hypothetical protein C5L14_00540 [Labrys okinawensis]|uniref:Uncharacterized protein n=1 Tax=Labrys okinawensis TaxID=346911 RepID=A0A2S9QIC1_9HYPH|nr:hypothetical protein [Labrys okinawensis]PRH89117.1 hypothetical protein C5L14_00540 [Labrys okinawensis]